METKINQLRQDPVFRHFYTLCQIPHGSGNEKALSDALLAWAREQGFEAMQDSSMNVLIRKPATPGYENAPGIMLQAHIDMVCEKAVDCDHDFARDPISWHIEGDILSTGGKTTLGADDGMGVALAMALLTDETLAHPPMEVLLTTMEEEDLSGAENFDTAHMNSTLLINLDHVKDDEVMCGSCGGMQVDFHMPVTSQPIPAGMETYRVKVEGLKGGHSGEDIHRGRGSANVLLIRLLMAAEALGPIGLVHIKGGTFRLAISREGEAMFTMDPAMEQAVREKFASLQADFRSELSKTADDVTVTLERAEPARHCVDPSAVLSVLTLFPDGIFQMNETLEGLVDTSSNMGEIYLNEEELHIVTEIRSARGSLCTYLFQRMERLAALVGGSCSSCNAYPSWDFRPDSKLRQICGQVYEEMFGTQPRFLTVHAGLEVGCFFGHKPEIDAVSMGPNTWDFHSPDERVSISSTQKVYAYLRNILAAIR